MSPLAKPPVALARRQTLAPWLGTTAVVGMVAFAAAQAVFSRLSSESEVAPVPELHPVDPLAETDSLAARSAPADTPAAIEGTGSSPAAGAASVDPHKAQPETCVLQSPLTETELLRVLWEGHVAWSGKPPTPQRLACAFAHCALEHARGKRIFGNNLGHVTTTGGWTGRSCQYSWTKRTSTHPDRWRVVRLRFRMHDTLQEGALDYWKLMGSQYRIALDACDAGDAEKAGRVLGELGYYTSDIDSYATAMKGLFVVARKRIKWAAGTALRP